MSSYAVIVGASRGIGQAVAVTLAKRHYEVILIARTDEGLKETAVLCGDNAITHVIPGDITIDLENIVKKIGEITNKVNLLWLGAAGYSEDALSEMTPDIIRSFIRSGFESLVELTHRVYPLLDSHGAQIIGACSDWSDFHTSGPSVFGSTKVALAGFLDKLRVEARKDNIHVTILKMGNVGNTAGYKLGESDRQLRETGRSYVSLDDICDVINFIISRKIGTISELTILPAE